MAITLQINGVDYPYPTTGDESWGSIATNWAQAVSNSTLQPNATVFALTTGTLDFGNNFGLKALYYLSRTTNPSSTGILRLANTDFIGFRNFSNSSDLPLGVDTSDNLTFNGIPIISSSGVVPVSSGGTGFSSYTVGDMLYASGSTTLSKLLIGTTSKVLVSTGSAPSWALLVNANIDPTAAIDYSKLNLSNSVVNADINSAAAIDFSKLAPLTSAHILVGDVSNVATDVAMSGDISIDNTGVTAYAGTVPISKGGTGQTTQTAAFNALSPLTTKGDLIVHDGTNNVRQGIGTDGQVLQADSTQASGVKWAAPGTTPPVVVIANLSTSTAYSPGDTIIYDNEVADTANAYNPSTGEFTAPATAYYQIEVNGATSPGTGSLYVDRLGTNLGYLTTVVAGNVRAGGLVFSLSLNDVITIKTDSSMTLLGSSQSNLAIFQIK